MGTQVANDALCTTGSICARLIVTVVHLAAILGVRASHKHGLAGVHEQQVIEVSSTEARWSMNRMERNSKPMDVCLSAAPSQLRLDPSGRPPARELLQPRLAGRFPTRRCVRIFLLG